MLKHATIKLRRWMHGDVHLYTFINAIHLIGFLFVSYFFSLMAWESSNESYCSPVRGLMVLWVLASSFEFLYVNKEGVPRRSEARREPSFLILTGLLVLLYWSLNASLYYYHAKSCLSENHLAFHLLNSLFVAVCAMFAYAFYWQKECFGPTLEEL